jgi:hypothetical protein
MGGVKLQLTKRKDGVVFFDSINWSSTVAAPAVLEVAAYIAGLG